MGTKWNGIPRNKPPRKISLKRLAKFKALNKAVGNGLNRGKAPRKVTPKTRKRNQNWKQVCLERAEYLISKYGFIICEYSGETITTLSSVPDTFEEGWGHHIDSNRNNCIPENCYIVKYKYHQFIEVNNMKVKQEDFQGN